MAGRGESKMMAALRRLRSDFQTWNADSIDPWFFAALSLYCIVPKRAQDARFVGRVTD